MSPTGHYILTWVSGSSVQICPIRDELPTSADIQIVLQWQKSLAFLTNIAGQFEQPPNVSAKSPQKLLPSFLHYSVLGIRLLFLFSLSRLALIASQSSPIYIALHNEQGQGLGLIPLQDIFPSLSYRHHPCGTSLLSARPPPPNPFI